MLNLNFRDYRRDDNFVTLQAEEPSGEGTFVINYVPPVGEAAVMKRAVGIDWLEASCPGDHGRPVRYPSISPALHTARSSPIAGAARRKGPMDTRFWN